MSDPQATEEQPAADKKPAPGAAEVPGAAKVPGAARVHDLGYQRYTGPRTAQSTRHRIIARKVVSTAWRGWWRMKLWVIGAAMAALVMSVVMYVSEGVSSLMRGGIKLSLTDALLPMSVQFFEISAIAMALTTAAVAVAGDLRTGAFEFYFSRPVRARDYVFGKILGITMIMGIPLFLGPVVLACVRLGLSGTDDVLHNIDVVPRAALLGVVASLAYAAVPLAFSAISSQKRHTLPAFATFYFLTIAIVPMVKWRSGMDWVEMFDISASVHTIAYALYDVEPLRGHRASGWLAFIGLAGYISAAIGFLYWRVSAAEKRGMGGR